MRKANRVDLCKLPLPHALHVANELQVQRDRDVAIFDNAADKRAFVRAVRDRKEQSLKAARRT